MARTKKTVLNPAAYGLTVQEAAHIIRLHDMCKGMDEAGFRQMETTAKAIKLVASLKKMDDQPGGAA